jgi:hypothetical protein
MPGRDLSKLIEVEVEGNSKMEYLTENAFSSLLTRVNSNPTMKLLPVSPPPPSLMGRV